MDEVLKTEDLQYVYQDDANSLCVRLDYMCLKSGDVRALTGVSGSGKSTLLECIGLIRDGYSAKSFILGDLDITALNAKKRAQARAAFLGFMPQAGGLLPFLTVRDNINLQLDLALRARHEKSDKSVYLNALNEQVDLLGMTKHLDVYPHQLSIGQRQRAVFFKAIAHHPKLVLIDEPTSSLDPINAAKLFDAIIAVSKNLGVAALAVTHDTALIRSKGIKEYSYQKNSTSTMSIFKADEESV